MAKTPIKKTTRGASKAGNSVAPTFSEKRSVRITEADNGFSVSTYGPKGEKIMVARNEAEAMRHCKTLLGKK